MHRIGRTGRAGLEGKAISIITPSDHRKLANIERVANTTIEKEKLPNAKLMVEIKKERLRHSLLHSWEKEEHEKYVEYAGELLNENTPENVIAALLDHFYKKALDPNSYKNIEQSSKEIAKRKSNEMRLFVAKGKDDGIFALKHLISFISSQTAVPAKDIQDIKIFDSFSFFNTPTASGELIVDVFRMEAKKGKKPLVVEAKEDRGGRRRSSEGGERRSKSKSGRGSRSEKPKRYGDRRDRSRSKSKYKAPGSFNKKKKDTKPKKKQRGKR